jgi:transglutaminase-like putative cysteine protease
MPLLFSLLAPSQAAPAYQIQTEPGKAFSAVYRTDIRSSTFKVVEYHVYVAIAPDLPSQASMKTTLDPEGTATVEQGDQKRPIYHAKVKAKENQDRLAVTVKFEGILMARKLVPLPRGAKAPKVAPLSDEERKNYLAATKLHDFESMPFQQWLKKNQLIRAAKESEIGIARRVFEAMLKQYTYALTGDMGPVSGMCAKTRGDCDSMSAVFVSALRANRVPARILSGLPARSIVPKEGGVIVGHARAEFYAEGIGWLPVDLAYAKTKRDPLAHFGQDHADLIVCHVDDEIVLPPPYSKELYNLGKPAFFALGRGTFDVKFHPVSWTVTFVP